MPYVIKDKDKGYVGGFDEEHQVVWFTTDWKRAKRFKKVGEAFAFKQSYEDAGFGLSKTAATVSVR